MQSPFIRKLEAFASLTPEEKAALACLGERVVERKAGEDLIREGERPASVHILHSGWAYRYKLMP